MIELSPVTAVTLYMLATLIPLILLWIKRPSKTTLPADEQNICHCPFCAHTFFTKNPQTPTKCPQCHNYR